MLFVSTRDVNWLLCKKKEIKFGGLDFTASSSISLLEALFLHEYFYIKTLIAQIARWLTPPKMLKKNGPSHGTIGYKLLPCWLLLRARVLLLPTDYSRMPIWHVLLLMTNYSSANDDYPCPLLFYWLSYFFPHWTFCHFHCLCRKTKSTLLIIAFYSSPLWCTINPSSSPISTSN